MTPPPTTPLLTKSGVIKLLFKRELESQAALVRSVSTGPEAAEAAEILKSVLGNRRKATARVRAEALKEGALAAPRRPWGKAVPERPERVPIEKSSVVAGHLPKTVRAEVGEVLKAVTKGGRFDRLLDLIGRQKLDELSARLRPLLVLAVKQDEQFRGQIATVSGWMLEHIRKASRAWREWAPARARAIMDAYNSHYGLDSRQAFRFPVRVENVLDGYKLPLSDGIILARSDAGRVLVLIIDEVKLKSVAGDVRAQFDEVIDRIRTRGLCVDGEFIPPHLIDLPVSTTRTGWSTELVAYLENANPRQLVTPAGYGVTVVGVESHDVRAFVEAFLTEWRKRLAGLGPK